MYWHPSLLPRRRRRTWVVPLAILLGTLALGLALRAGSRAVGGYAVTADFAPPLLALPFVLPIMARN